MRSKILALIPAALALSLSACSGTPAEQPADTKAANAASAAGYFTVPAAQLSHLQIVPAVTTTWTTTLHTTGTVDWDNDHTTQAITQVSGPITRIVVDTGARVKAGDPLLYVSSPDVAGAISTYRKAKNRLDLAQKTLDRSHDLLAHKAIAARDMEGAEADFNDASTDLQTALQSLKIFGVTQADLDDAEKQNSAIRPELPMRAPISGMVVQKLVLPGQLIQAGTTIAFVISDVSTVWVQGHIYEKDLTSVRVGDTVEARNSAFPVVFHGTIAYIDHLLDPATRTTLVRIVTKNPDGLLRKDLFLDVTVQDQTRRQVLTVPVTAVLYDEQNFPFVYVQVETGKFAQHLVKMGGQQGDQVEILDGVKAGDLVVSQGSVFLQFANTFAK
jgi:cobalt-zinc-cadmium efflux system membrane fusion protein